MKTETTITGGFRRNNGFLQTARNIAFAGAFAFTAIAAPQALADEEYEWDPTWGIHEEEWYDPSDWFNEDGQIDYEDTGTFAYDDNYYYNDVWDGYDYYGDYGYDYASYDPDVTGSDSYYQWSPSDSTWNEVKGDETASNEKRNEAQEMSKDKKNKSIDKQNVMTMRGTITSVGKAKLKGGDKDHTFVMINAGKDKPVLVDFGPKANIDNINLEKDQKIQVRGPRTKLNGRFILVAQQVSHVGKDGAKKSNDGNN